MDVKCKISFLLLLFALPLRADIQGVVVDDGGDALVGANVYWQGTTIGTATDAEGLFSLPEVKGVRQLIATYVGYHSDTAEVRKSNAPITFVLVSDVALDEVEIVERRMAVLRSRYSALNIETLTGESLCKAACCNLSESFETNASVDVSYADAATGAKQIRLLGLSGTYVQMLTENTPSIRGLAQQFGMEYIPGSWMEAIQVSKGTSSVVNGYEALTGQINVDYLHPHSADPLAVNALISKDLKAELNLTGAWKVNDITQTGLLIHAQGQFLTMDDNHDGFSDMPTGYHLNILNRWGWKKGIWGSKLLLRGLYDQRIAGQVPAAQAAVAKPYIIDLRTRRVDAIWKNGLTWNQRLGTSLGLISAVSYHDQTNLYGSNTWQASQVNAYFNAIFQTEFESNRSLRQSTESKHKLAAGLSLNYDRYHQSMDEMPFASVLGLQQEFTPGIFAEYTYTYSTMLTILIGIREDYTYSVGQLAVPRLEHGFFTTPRMNVRFAPFEWWTLRASVGLGSRTPCLIADNASYLSSNRQWLLPTAISREQALNTGATTIFYIPIGKRQMQLSLEYYYTRFLDGMLVDVDRAPSQLYFYSMRENPDLQSFAHNYQVEANMEVLRGWTWTLAFRYTDTRQSSFHTPTQQYIVRDKPLQNRFKGLISTSYQTPLKKWQFDLTAQFNGFGRMPDGFCVPEDAQEQYYTRSGVLYHTWYPQLLAQVTKYFRHASLYLGAENMTNFTQKHPILGTKQPDTGYINPYAAGYDASQVWGPIHGWKLYLGFRWHLDRED